MAKYPVNLLALQTELGTMKTRLYKNEHTGLPMILNYEIDVPLQEFNSGVEYEIQPVKTGFVLDCIPLPIQDWRMLTNQYFSFNRTYYHGGLSVGNAHNPVFIDSLKIRRTELGAFVIDCSLLCDFEFQSQWESEEIRFNADIVFKGLEIDSRDVNIDLTIKEVAREFLAHYVTIDGYILSPIENGVYFIFPPNLE